MSAAFLPILAENVMLHILIINCKIEWKLYSSVQDI